MYLTITKLIAGLGLALAFACDSLEQEQLLEIEMFGVSQSGSLAPGDSTPDYQSYRLLEVALINADGNTLTKLFDNEEEKVFRIIDRIQLIYSKPIEDLLGKTYSGIRVKFDPEVTGGTETNSDMKFTLQEPEKILIKAFTVETAQSLLLQVKISWGNTVLGDAMTEPSIELTLK